MTFEIAIEPGARWHCCLRYDLSDGREQYQAPVACASSHSDLSEGCKRLAQWNSVVLKLESSHETLRSVFQQATDDLAALRLPIKGSALRADTHVVPAAGLPWFLALFGRDSLITSLQTSLVYPSFARGTLEVLGARQAKDRDDYRDAEPGKIMHELRLGELAHFILVPHTPYYGTADATPLYLITLHAA
jgi:glycogen debranching enzyme